MTDESHGSEPGRDLTPPPGMPPQEHDDAAVVEGAGDFTSGEGLVAFAGMVLVAVWLIFDIIINGYGMDNLVPVIATVAILLPRLRAGTVERIAPLPVLMKLAGWALVFLGVVELIIDLRFNAFRDVAGVIGALAAYAGYAMAFMGARQIDI